MKLPKSVCSADMLLIYWLGIMLVETPQILSDHKSANDSSIKVQVRTDLYRPTP